MGGRGRGRTDAGAPPLPRVLVEQGKEERRRGHQLFCCEGLNDRRQVGRRFLGGFPFLSSERSSLQRLRDSRAEESGRGSHATPKTEMCTVYCAKPSVTRYLNYLGRNPHII